MKRVYNLFLKFVTWSGCIEIAVEKFGTIGYKKTGSTKVKLEDRIEAFDPGLIIDGHNIPYLGNQETFKFLGKVYAVDLSQTGVQKFVKKFSDELLTKINNCALSNFKKAEMFNIGYASFMRWNLTIHNLPLSFIETIKIQINKLLRLWIGLPNGTTEHFFYISKKRNGLGFTDVVQV